MGTTADTGSAGNAEATFRAESNSIGSQRELIRSFIREQEDIELLTAMQMTIIPAATSRDQNLKG